MKISGISIYIFPAEGSDSFGDGDIGHLRYGLGKNILIPPVPKQHIF
jgi:hypothetical protein